MLAQLLRLSRAKSALAFAAVLSPAVGLPAQVFQGFVSYGDQRNGTISQPAQRHLWVLQNVVAGDTLRITFCSQSVCCPRYLHQMTVTDPQNGGSQVGPTIAGLGVLTVAVPSNGALNINVQAINNTDTGWYAFQVNRLNDPAKADRIALNWQISGSIAATAGFDVYTLSALGGSSATLTFSSQAVCCPRYLHYAEIVDALGAQVPGAIVNGIGSASFTFPVSGVYTLFVAAENYEDTGWYSASLSCNTWPFTPCGFQPYTGNYGQGWPGTNGVPTLTSTVPAIGMPLTFSLGNSAGAATQGVLLLGANPASIPTTFGGTLLVQVTTFFGPIPLLPGGGTYTVPIPTLSALLGFGTAWQSIVVDPGASHTLAFSPGLAVIF